MNELQTRINHFLLAISSWKQREHVRRGDTVTKAKCIALIDGWLVLHKRDKRECIISRTNRGLSLMGVDTPLRYEANPYGEMRQMLIVRIISIGDPNGFGVLRPIRRERYYKFDNAQRPKWQITAWQEHHDNKIPHQTQHRKAIHEYLEGLDHSAFEYSNH